MLQASSLSFHRHTFSAREASPAMPYLNKNDLERDWIDGPGAGVDCTIDIAPLALKLACVEEWNCLGVLTRKTSSALTRDPEWRKHVERACHDGTGFEPCNISCPCLESSRAFHMSLNCISLCAKTTLCSSYKSFFGSLCVSNNYTIYVQVVQNSTS